MAGWNLRQGELVKVATEEELWQHFNFLFSDGSRKRNSYKFGLIKSILDNLLNVEATELGAFLSYYDIFAKFTENYWNLVVKYDLRQMRRDGKSQISKIETIITNSIEKYGILTNIDYSIIPINEKEIIIKEVTKECKRCVVGALYTDFDGLLYSFDLKADGIILSLSAYEFMLKYKLEIEKMNYYSWAKFIESVNSDDKTIRLLDKLELSTPRRGNLSIYREILRKEFETNNCFYCGRTLKKSVHVDHFIPWSYVKEDKLWDFVLACPDCNQKKKDKIPSRKCLQDAEKRNLILAESENEFVRKEFESYYDGLLTKMWEYALMSGYKEYKIGSTR